MNAISVHNLGKKFKLFKSQSGRFIEYITLRHLLRHTDFWALKDITFEVPHGTTLGILGQNGSGKSTLLSILAGVLEPTVGSFRINGKVSAILELGSGFHPEFSGRDNVYMYGSIMGLSKDEIDGKFKEIIDFSELGDLIDQPLRTYSSGMIVRLAFSVAVNVNADILIVDEALAVGDAIFQHRCFRKIHEMHEAGKTILYVGHDTEAVRNLCTHALLLDGGRIIERGDPNTVVNKYYTLIAERERAYSEGNLIEHGELPNKDYEIAYDFIQNFPKAKIESAEGIPVKLQTIEILSVLRNIIFAHPPSQITYTITIIPGSSLALAIGILPAAWDKISEGVKFDIDIESEGTTENIFSRVLQPKRNIGDRGWHNFIIPMEKFSGKTILITFITSGSGEDLSYGWSAWGWIKLITISHLESKEHDNDIDVSDQKNINPANFGNKRAELIKIELLDKDGYQKKVFNSGDYSTIVITILFNDNIDSDFDVGYKMFGKYGIVYGTCTLWHRIAFKEHKKGDIIKIKFFQRLSLAPGYYSIDVDLCRAVYPANEIDFFHVVTQAVVFQIESLKPFSGIIDLYSKIIIDGD